MVTLLQPEDSFHDDIYVDNKQQKQSKFQKIKIILTKPSKHKKQLMLTFFVVQHLLKILVSKYN